MTHDPDHTYWGTAVSVHIGTGPAEFIHNEHEALDYQYARWPLTDGPHMFNAKKKCREAIDHGGNANLARQAFVAAAIEADILS